MAFTNSVWLWVVLTALFVMNLTNVAISLFPWFPQPDSEVPLGNLTCTLGAAWQEGVYQFKSCKALTWLQMHSVTMSG